jgi:hypothetical protein
MPGPARPILLLVALPLALLTGLLAGVEPGSTATVGARPAPVVFAPGPHHFRPGPRGPGQPLDGNAAVGRGPARGSFVRRERPPVITSLQAAPRTGSTFDGWRMLEALALTGGVAGAVWYAARDEQGARLPAPPGSSVEQDVAFLREEVERLQREQRQLRTTLDWQERLLAEGSPDASADA